MIQPPPARRLPPLNALRAFEAAARHLSFTKAAEELHVTQAAISHQVKALEEVLGMPLFRRLNRRLVLTDSGQRYLPPLREAFDMLQVATDRLRADEQAGALRLSVIPSFAAKWLLPRLPRFRQRHPEIDVLLSATEKLTDFAREQVDLGIRYGRGHYPGLRVDLLMRDEIFPVCSPRLLEGPHPLRAPADLKHHTLLHDQVYATEDDPDWRLWLRTAGITGIDTNRGPGFSHTNMVAEAAIAGQGVALCRSSIVSDDIEAGRLVQPFGPRLPSSFVYTVVSLPESADLPKVRDFREWIMEEAASGRAGLPLRPLPSSENSAEERPEERPEEMQKEHG
jgi:LysR family glycine cleavage system transcriptional activator